MSVVLSPATKLGDYRFAPNWHEQMVAVRLAVAPTDQVATHKAISELLGELAHDNQPFDWRAEVTHRTNGQRIDAERWTPSFGEENDVRSAGIVHADANLGGDGGFYVVARTGGGAASRALNTFVLDNPNMTVGELMQRPEYRVAEEYASRNARRICALIAGALTTGAVSTLIKTEPDLMAARGSSNVAAPVLAVPTVHHTYNTLTASNVGAAAARQGGAVVYVGAENNTAAPGTHALIACGAIDGFVLRPIGAACTNVSLVPTRMHDSQQDNQRFWARKEGSGSDFKRHVYSRYLTRTGETPSSATRALWVESPIGLSIGTNDVRLVPYVLIVHGKPALSLTGANA